MAGGISPATQELALQQSLAQAHSVNNKAVPLDFCADSESRQHIQYGLAAVAFLRCETADAGDMAGAAAECRQHGNHGEEVGAVGCVKVEGGQWCFADVDDAAFLFLGHACSCPGEYIHHREVRLKGACVQPFKICASEYRPCCNECGSRTPVGLDIHLGSLVALPSAYPDGHPVTQAPVVALKKFLPSFHLALNMYAEFLQYVYGYVDVWYALGIVDMDLAVPVGQRQGCKQPGNELRTVFA